ncbi:MAG: hypothetical protein JWQ32_2660 [Marmoricola sp.]|nr:hypothetical protein [Marmoricola sp.]
MTIAVRRGDDRFLTEAEGRTTWHSFSFGSHYDGSNVGFGAIVALNDELLPPGTGYDDHLHRDTEIVTWVLEGALRHTDTSGESTVLTAGDVQRISAGDGIVHAERTEPGIRTRFVQTWLRPDEPGGVPSYAIERAGTGLVELTAAGLGLGVANARLLVGRAGTGDLVLPGAPLLHVFVVEGQAALDGRLLGTGDAARIVDEGGLTLSVTTPATVAVWAFGS